MTDTYEKYNIKANLCSDLEEINCDPDRLKQVFMNVIANGIEAMEDGGTITITTEAFSEGVEIRISDEGSGISEEDLIHIFEPFYTTRESGSGLGLAISYKIVEAHKGEISAMSEPGEQTTFVIRLPAK
jgi:signal transduction histidine kinase